jgi:tetratricopeptide (TPR) repeat protein
LLDRVAEVSGPVVLLRRPVLPVGTSLAGGRLSALRHIGEGGMGVVYEAFDSERRARVALKTLVQLDASSVYRLKNEFRALADVRHPNLVQLHELFADGASWFFTMELIDGERFDRWVRPTTEGANGAPLDEARLRDALPHLLAAIEAIHAAGKLHRDLKPSNVLVTPGGRVVVLDFGLAIDPEAGGIGQTVADDSVSGTPAYMAPEQAAGRSATPASDFYALGVMLFEALTGVLPFGGRSGEMQSAKQRDDAPSVTSIAPLAPADLAAICAKLLEREPALRPDAAQLRAFFLASGADGHGTTGATEGRRAALQSPTFDAAPELFGRQAELLELRDAYKTTVAGRAVVAIVSGESGMGKSALVEAFLHELRAGGPAVVLAGRCHERENVPYKGFDALVDDLSRQLRRLPAHAAAALLPREVFALARLFPVLDRVPVIAQAPRKDVPDPQDLQQRAFAAFGELLARLRDRQPLVVFIDDLQWTDQDAARFMRQLLLHPQPVPALVLLAHRIEHASESALLQSVIEAASSNRGLSVRTLQVGALEQEALTELALARLPVDDQTQRLASAIAREAQGNPFFAGELARAARIQDPTAAAPTLTTALQAHVGGIPADARRLLSVLALAGQPLAPAVAIAAAGLSSGHDALDLLRSERLLRVSIDSDGARSVECYHDKVRELVAHGLDEALTRELFGTLAQALLASPEGDPDLLTRCLEGAGLPLQAAGQAQEAADRAMQVLAFDRAARLYEKALQLGTWTGERLRALRVARADALSWAGRGTVAAEAYLAARSSGTPEQASVLTRRAAEQYLMCGRVARGRELLAEGLRPLGLDVPESAAGAFASLIWWRAQLRMRGLDFVARERHDPIALARLEALRIATNCFGRTDWVRFASFSARYTLVALDGGHAVEVARAVGCELVLAAGMRPRRQWIELLERRAAALCESTGDVEARARFHHGRGLCQICIDLPWCGNLKDGMAETAQAREIVKARPYPTAVYDESWLRWQASVALAYDGRLDESIAELQVNLESTLAKGDVSVVSGLVSVGAFVLPGLGRIDEAERLLARGLSVWHSDETTLQDVQFLLASVWIAAYRGESRAGWRKCQPSLQRLNQSFLPRVSFGPMVDSTVAGHVVAASFEAPDSTERRTLADEARRIAKRAARGSNASRLNARVVMACLTGDREAAVTALRAFLRLPALNPLYDFLGGRRLGVLLGGDEGHTLVHQADAWMRERKVVDPERFTAMLMPGMEIR